MAFELGISENLPTIPKKIFTHFAKKHSLQVKESYKSRPYGKVDYELDHTQLSYGDREIMEQDKNKMTLFETTVYSVPSELKTEYYLVTRYYVPQKAMQLQAMSYPITDNDIKRIIADEEYTNDMAG